MVISRKSKHPLTLLRGYKMLLQGSSDIEILSKNVKASDLAKIQRFHDCVSQKKHYLTVAYENCIDLKLAKRMLDMYEAHDRGEPILVFTKRTQAAYALRLILSGLSDSEILEKRVSEVGINTANNFLEITPYSETMLLATISKKIGVSRDLACKMVKIYRDKQAEMIQLEELQDNRMIPIPITA